MSRAGDGVLGGSGDDEESDGDGGEVDPAATDAGATQKKRKKRNKKKSKKKTKPDSSVEQTSPPRVPLDQVFPAGNFPEGEVQSYQATARTTAAERRHDSRQYWEDEAFLKNYRKAAEIHRQTRRWVQETAKPGQSLHDIAVGIEDSVRALLDNAGLGPGDGLKSGMGFPTGLCLNNQVAHYTPNPGQKPVVLQQQDVLTVDFGVHINGWIVDSAFTTAFDPTYDNLLAAVKDATNTGVKVPNLRVPVSSAVTRTNTIFRPPASTCASATSAPPSRKSWRATRSKSAARRTASSPSATSRATTSSSSTSTAASPSRL
jgi:methionyl aminopeptidase